MAVYATILICLCCGLCQFRTCHVIILHYTTEGQPKNILITSLKIQNLPVYQKHCHEDMEERVLTLCKLFIMYSLLFRKQEYVSWHYSNTSVVLIHWLQIETCRYKLIPYLTAMYICICDEYVYDRALMHSLPHR